MNTKKIKSGFAVVAISVLVGCATSPTTPTITILPGVNKNKNDFETDYSACQHNIKVTPADNSSAALQQSFNAAFGQCMYSLGNEVPGVYPSHVAVPLPSPISPLFSPPTVNGGGYTPAN